jgi:DnaJ-class molecular chaperone
MSLERALTVDEVCRQRSLVVEEDTFVPCEDCGGEGTIEGGAGRYICGGCDGAGGFDDE